MKLRKIRYTASVNVREFCRQYGMYLCIAALIVFAYSQALSNPFVVWDDMSLIVENTDVHSINARTLKNIFTTFDPELYIPLTLLSYQIEYALAGDAPFLYHLSNIVLHILNACLVFALIGRMTDKRWAAGVAAILFAVHPLHTETVAWASARKDLLATFFFLASMLLYVRRKQTENTMASVALFIAGALSKVTVITLPVLLLLHELRQGTPWKKACATLAPYFAVSVLFGVVAVVGKQQKISVLNVWEKLLIACKSLTFTIERIVFPHRLAALHPHFDSVSVASFTFGGSLLLCCLFVAAVAAAWIKKKPSSYWLLFFLITVVPSFANQTKGSGIVITYDRYAYLPSLGIIVFIVLMIDKLRHSRWFAVAKRRMIITEAVLCLMLVFSVMTKQQVNVWSSTQKLFENVAAYYPESDVAQEHLGSIAMKEGRYRDAIDAYALSAMHRSDPAAAYVNIGTAYSKLGMTEKEQEAYEKSLLLNPRQIAARYNLARSYEDTNQFDKARDQYVLIQEENDNFLDTNSRIKSLEERLRWLK